MNYYKVIVDHNIVGVCSEYEFRRTQTKHNLIVTAERDQVECIQIGEKYYRDDWMIPTRIACVHAMILQIPEAEYLALQSALDSGDEVEDISGEDTTEQNEDTSVDPVEGLTLDFVKQRKISEMSLACSNAITAGVDVSLDDDEPHHFSLDVTDQFMISVLASKAQQGNTPLPWHADGEPCRYFTVNEILHLYEAMEALVTYHQTYFNSLKFYISSLDNIEEIAAVTYGCRIPEEYRSDVLKTILENTGDEDGD